MKKTISKLTLNRETLRRLDEDQMQGVAGALPVSLQASRCDTCGIACTVYTCPARTCGPEA
jgi:hypothetical protein